MSTPGVAVLRDAVDDLRRCAAESEARQLGGAADRAGASLDLVVVGAQHQRVRDADAEGRGVAADRLARAVHPADDLGNLLG